MNRISEEGIFVETLQQHFDALVAEIERNFEGFLAWFGEFFNSFSFYDISIAIGIFVLLIMFAMTLVLFPKDYVAKHTSFSVTGNDSASEDDDEEDEEEPPCGVLQWFDEKGDLIDTKIVFSEEPDCSDGILSFCSTRDGEYEEVRVKSTEFVVFRDDDTEFVPKQEWIIVVVGPSGEAVFREIARDGTGRPEVEDNGVRALDQGGHPIAIYCGDGLGIAVLPHRGDTVVSQTTTAQ